MGGRTLHLRESLDVLRLIVFRQLGHTLDFDWAKKKHMVAAFGSYRQILDHRTLPVTL